MSTWSEEWMPAARTALVDLRGSSATGADGLPLPALSTIDATSALAQLTKAVLGQLPRLGTDGTCAASTTEVDEFGHRSWTPGAFSSAVGPAEFLAMFPGPQPSPAWFRSPRDFRPLGDYSDYGDAAGTLAELDAEAVAAQWARAMAGEPASEALPGWAIAEGDINRVYTLYTPNASDGQRAPGGIFGDIVGASGELVELRELVSAYQRACDAIADGAMGTGDLASAMPVAALQAFWSALGAVATSLDTLADVPPRPPTMQGLEEAARAAATWIGDAAAGVANISGKLVGNVAGGFLGGIGVYGIAAAVVVIALFLATR